LGKNAILGHFGSKKAYFDHFTLFQLFSALFAIFLRKHPVDHENIDLKIYFNKIYFIIFSLKNRKKKQKSRKVPKG